MSAPITAWLVQEIAPYSAWVQAVFVVLFIALVIYLLRYMSEQNKNFQSFIVDWTTQRDSQWQIWLDGQRDAYRRSLENVEKSIDCINTSVHDLAKVTGDLVEMVEAMRKDQKEHFEKEEAVIQRINSGRKKAG